MSIIFWSLVAGLAAVGNEAIFRSHRDSTFASVMLYTVPIQVVVSYSIWRLLHEQTIIGFAIIFGMVTAGLRIGATMLLGDIVKTGELVGFGLLVAANAIKVIFR